MDHAMKKAKTGIKMNKPKASKEELAERVNKAAKASPLGYVGKKK